MHYTRCINIIVDLNLYFVITEEEIILISMILAIDYQQYIAVENSIIKQIEADLFTLGFTIADTNIEAMEYGEKQ